MNIQVNQYACFAYTTQTGDVDIADGNVVEVDNDSVVIDYNNVIGPATPMRIGLNSIIEQF